MQRQVRPSLEQLECRECPAVGGGFTNAGILGDYFNNTTLAGAPSFQRSDVRVDFDWGTATTPGGSASAGFSDIGHNNFSVRWTGQVVPAFSEIYTFKATSDDGVRLYIKAADATTWTTVIDDWAAHTTKDDTATFAMISGKSYDIKMEYYQASGAAVAKLAWSSPSTPLETIDTLIQTGINLPDLTAGYTDIVKGAQRNTWWPASNGVTPGMDANGWPTGDGGYVFQESLNQGLDIDPLMLGKISFSFNGKATVSLWGNVNNSSLTYSYDAATNTTAGSFITANNHANASFFYFSNSHRDGVATGPGGITNLKLMRPTAPGASTNYDPSVTFTPQFKTSVSQYTLMRYAFGENQQVNWSDRTSPNFFNQNLGSTTAPHMGNGTATNNGFSWEYKIRLANETGRDMMISIPVLASGNSPTDTTSYIYNLANLIKYGSDQNGTPYTSPQANPVNPGLNPNLRVYLELENELWNYASAFYTTYANLNSLVAANVAANNADFKIINFDNLSTAKNSSGNYVNLDTWRYREAILRMIQISDIFRSVWGDSAMMTNVRPLYEWQYDNQNNTASTALTFADRYFNNGDGQQHVANPQPLSHWLWGAGGASYYGAVNGNGLTNLLPNSDFETPTLSAPGFASNVAGSAWTFMGTAGIAKTGAPGIPPASNGSQMAYITDNGSMSITFTAPATQTSNVYGVSFKAVNAAGNSENIRVYLDDTIDITAKTASQTNGYTPGVYNSGSPWKAQNVYWSISDYYYTVSFNLTTGSTHKITIKGAKAAGSGQTVFLDDVRVTSVDAIFAGGIPGGGEANGQPVGSNIQNTMNVEANWARAYGLQPLGYEGGWSLGGDDGGSWVQTLAKYSDPRAAAAQSAYMTYFLQSGSTVNVLGTYNQWPNWADYYAQQGLLNVKQYPLVQGVNAMSNALAPIPTNGVLLPNTLRPSSAVIAVNANQTTGQISGAGGYLNWNVIAPQTGTYTLTLTTTGTGGSLVFLVDDRVVVATGASGSAFSGTIALTRGIHSIKVRSTSATAFTVAQIAVVQMGGTSAPTLNSASDTDAAVTLAWAPVAGAVGYKVAYGTSAGVYGPPVDAGTSLAWTVSGLTNNQTYYFAVYSYGSNGILSLPSNEKMVTPFANGQTTNLVGWDFKGNVGNEASISAANSSVRATASALTRGPRLNPNAWPWNGDGAYAGIAPSHAQTLAEAKSTGEYYQFSTGPASGYRLAVSGLQFRFFDQNHPSFLGNISLAWSTDGVNFTDAPAMTFANNWVSANLSGVSALQNVSANVYFRIYVFGNASYEAHGFYSNPGNDIIVSGAVSAAATSAPAAPTINSAVAGNASVSLTWATVSGAAGYKVAYGTISGVYNQTIDVGAATAYTVAGLTNSQQYFFATYAYNSNGLLSVASAEKTATPLAPAPAAPTLNSAVAGNASVSLTWATVSGAAGYKVAYGTTSGVYNQTIDVGAATAYTVAGLTNSQPYFFVTYAYGSNGLVSVASAEKTATPLAPTLAATSITSASDKDSAVSLAWNPVTGAIGYKIAYGTSSKTYTQTVDVGAAVASTISGLINNQAYYFAVYAYASNGATSAASAEKVVVPFANGQITNLVGWDLVGDKGNETSQPVASNSVRATGGSITRGPRLNPQAWPWNGNGAFAGIAPTHAQTLAEAKSTGEYYQFSAGPASGYKLALSGLQFRFFVQERSTPLSNISLAWSTDGVNFTDGPALTYVNNLVTANLSGVSALQNVSGNVYFRVYTYGYAAYYTSGFYSGSGNDLVVSGAVAPSAVAPTVKSAVINGNLSGLAGSQRSMVDSIVYTFSQAVQLNSGAFTIGVHAGQTGSLPTLSWSSSDGGLTWVVYLGGTSAKPQSIADGVYDIQLHASAVKAVSGGLSMTADRTDTFYRLFGDIDGNKAVDATDLSRFNLALNATTGQANYVAAFDYNINGSIGSWDQSMLNANSGKKLTGFTASI